MKPATVALRDQVLAFLERGYPLPASTREIAESMPMREYRLPCHPWRHHGMDRHPTHPGSVIVKEICLGGEHLVRAHQWTTYVYPHLRALEAKGLITRVRIDGHRDVYWQATQSADDTVAALETIWNAS